VPSRRWRMISSTRHTHDSTAAARAEPHSETVRSPRSAGACPNREHQVRGPSSGPRTSARSNAPTTQDADRGCGMPNAGQLSETSWSAPENSLMYGLWPDGELKNGKEAYG
jgi:hypothetical protein